MHFKGWIIAAALILSGATNHARAQNLFGGGATAYDPQISVLNTGAILDAKPVVSRDLKYVNITARPTVSQLIALQQYSIPLPANMGFVGSVALQNQAMKERGIKIAGGTLPTPSPLDRRGITKLD